MPELTDDQLAQYQKKLARAKKAFNEFLAARDARSRRAAWNFLREQVDGLEELIDSVEED